MKLRYLAVSVVLLVGLVAWVGCYTTPSGSLRIGSPVRASVEGAYERPFEQVCRAAVDVIKFNGTFVSETQLQNQTNLVKLIEGRVEQNRVIVRVERLDPRLTGVVVQARTSVGGANLDLAHEIEKQIALRLATMSY